jgi:hypothetical protein
MTSFRRCASAWIRQQAASGWQVTFEGVAVAIRP